MIGFRFDDRVGYFPTDWNLQQLKDSGDFVSGSTPSSTNENYWGGDITWLVPSDLTALSDSTNYIYDSESKITIEGFNSCSTNMLPVGSLCLSSRATIGEAVIAGVELCTNQGFINIIPNEKHHALYLLYWVKNNKQYISRYAAGTTFLEIGRRTFKNLKIALPKDPPEQKAIAGILSKVDEAIEAVENSIKAAERLKKSLMQNLLTGKLKPDGTWRSEDEFYVDEKFGKVPKGWEVKKLKNVCNSAGEYGANASAIDFTEELPHFIRITDIDDLGNLIEENKAGIEADKAKNYILKENDFLFARTGDTVGKSLLYKDSMGLSAFAGYLIKFTFLTDVIIPEYFDLVAKSDLFEAFKIAMKRVGAKPNINSREYGSFRFVLPTNKGEQKEIIENVTPLNSFTINNHKKIRSLKTLKKSLMQNLLTGKVRVDVEKINKLLEEV